jgi:type I restriction enzyme S subunit
MKTATLANVATLSSGGTPPRTSAESYGAGTPWVSITDLNDGLVEHTKESLTTVGIANSAAKTLPPGTLLVAMYGASIGKLGVAGTTLCTNQAIAAIQPVDNKLSGRYLYHYLLAQRKNLRARGRGGAQPNISLGDLQNWPIPLPPLAEQRRIAAILDHADGLRAKRRQSITQLSSLGEAMFLDMFGDPDFALASGAVVKFGDIADLQGGRNLVAEDEENASDFRVLKISAVTSGQFKPTESKALPSGYQPPTEHMVRQGDLLISRANTSELVGAVAYVEDIPSNLVLPDKIWRFVWRDSESDPLFYRSLFRTAAIRRRISQLSSGTGGSMKNISKAKLSQLELPKVDIPAQREFARRIAAIPRSRTDEFDELFASLQSRAFTGQL